MKILTALATFLLCLPAVALTIPSDGSDGEFAPEQDIQIDLGLAVEATWDTPGDGNGIYDPDQWVVVFKYSTVTIANNIDVTFRNHPSGAPVIWLLQGDVTITGSVRLDGESTTFGNEPPFAPGPGGFRSGRTRSPQVEASAGYGPGGGNIEILGNTVAAAGGSYGSLGQDNQSTVEGSLLGSLYGNARLFPLVGGSGGAGDESGNGAPGGGAILIATPGSFLLDGAISANGGQAGANASQQPGGGSGGAIRLIADTISGIGSLEAVGGGGNSDGGLGRIVVEANTVNLLEVGNPPFPTFAPEEQPLIFRDVDTPSAEITQVDASLVEADRLGQGPGTVVGTPGAYTVTVVCNNVPTDAEVVVRATPATGAATIADATFVSGDVDESTWTADITFAGGTTTLQARAILP